MRPRGETAETLVFVLWEIPKVYSNVDDFRHVLRANFKKRKSIKIKNFHTPTSILLRRNVYIEVRV